MHIWAFPSGSGKGTSMSVQTGRIEEQIQSTGAVPKEIAVLQRAPRSLMFSSADLMVNSLLPSPEVWKEPGFFYFMHSLCCVFLMISQKIIESENDVLQEHCTFSYPHTGERERVSSLVSLLIKALIPPHGLHPHGSVTTQRPHLQPPSHRHSGDQSFNI